MACPTRKTEDVLKQIGCEGVPMESAAPEPAADHGKLVKLVLDSSAFVERLTCKALGLAAAPRARVSGLVTGLAACTLLAACMTAPSPVTAEPPTPVPPTEQPQPTATLRPTETPFPTATATATLPPTPTATATVQLPPCAGNPEVSDAFAQYYNRITGYSDEDKDFAWQVIGWKENNGAVHTWYGYGISTGKTRDRVIDVDGRSYTLHTVEVLLGGKDDETQTLFPVEVAYGVTHPDGSYYEFNHAFEAKFQHTDREWSETTLTPFGTVLRFTTPAGPNGMNWARCEAETLQYQFYSLTPDVCRIGSMLSPQNDGVLTRLQQGEAPPEDWVMMGHSLRQAAQAADDPYLPFDEMPACQP